MQEEFALLDSKITERDLLDLIIEHPSLTITQLEVEYTKKKLQTNLLTEESYRFMQYLHFDLLDVLYKLLDKRLIKTFLGGKVDLI